MNELFDDLRPYTDPEINQAMNRVADHPYILPLMSYLYSPALCQEKIAALRTIETVHDFQMQVMHSAINSIIEKTITKLTYHGLENLDPSMRYLFVSNHRDILLDSALLQVVLATNGFRTSEITFGSNLMQNDFVVDIGKSNKMFKVIRGGNPYEFYRNSVHLSRYIRNTLCEKRESIWIAQRNGRTKDGNDSTDQGLIKMFSMSGGKDMVENLAELHIVPMAISYQYETCDRLKTRELYLSRDRRYIKTPTEDFDSILSGVMEFKGNVHIEFCPPLDRETLSDLKHLEKNGFINAVAKTIDERIHLGYKLWDTNYIAHDMLYQTFDYTDHYTMEEYHAFAERMHERLQFFEGNEGELMTIFLEMYAYPIKNYAQYFNH